LLNSVPNLVLLNSVPNLVLLNSVPTSSEVQKRVVWTC